MAIHFLKISSFKGVQVTNLIGEKLDNQFTSGWSLNKMESQMFSKQTQTVPSPLTVN